MKAVMFFAEGFEEVEALSVVDVLRRGGVEVQMTAITEKGVSDGKYHIVTGAHGIGICMDSDIHNINIEETDAFLLPGGMPGTKNLKSSKVVCDILVRAYENEKLVGAICAAPSVLGACGILKGKKATCYPGFEQELIGADVRMDAVVVDGTVVTSRGVGTALDFGLKILSLLTNEENSKNIKESILY